MSNLILEVKKRDPIFFIPALYGINPNRDTENPGTKFLLIHHMHDSFVRPEQTQIAAKKALEFLGVMTQVRRSSK